MKKRNMKKTLSGFMAVMTIMSSLLSPAAVYAMEEAETEKKPPLYEEIKDLLDEDEVVKAKDLELEYGSQFDLEFDFSYIEIPDNEAVKVTFEEAKNKAGDEFSTIKPDTYEAVYYVEPQKTDHPMYQISRNLIVREEGVEVVRELPTETEIGPVTDMDGAENGIQEESTEEEEEEDSQLQSESIPETAIEQVFEEYFPAEEELTEETTPMETESTELPVETEEAFSEMEEISVTITEAEETESTLPVMEQETEPVFILESMEPESERVSVLEAVEQEEEQDVLTDLMIYAEGEVFVNAVTTEHGVEFVYESRPQKGASFRLFAAEDIFKADGTLLYRSGELVRGDLQAGEAGSICLLDLYAGTYSILQTKAGYGYVCHNEAKTITLPGDKNDASKKSEVHFKNLRQKAVIQVKSADCETKNELRGGKFGLYATDDIRNDNDEIVVAKDTLLDTAITGADGSVIFSADLPLGNRYYCREVQAPDGYRRDQSTTYYLEFEYTHDRQEASAYSFAFYNERVDARIILTIQDSETHENTQGDASFEDAIYGIYAREDIVNPDGKSGVVYRKDAQAGTLRTNPDGEAEISGLFLGKYYVKAITASAGYLPDEKEYEIECSFAGDLTPTVEYSMTSECNVMRQPFQVIKVAKNNKTDADLISGAGFSAWLISELKKNPDGTYDYTSADPVMLTEDDKTEIFTDRKGYAVSMALPYGSYLVKETSTPHNFAAVDDFIVNITKNDPKNPQVWRVLLDEEFMAKLKIVKHDGETKNAVLIPDAEFRVYDLDHQKYVEQVTTYPSTYVHKSYFTDRSGSLILPENLEPGNYRIEEVQAPYGYILNEDTVEVKIDSNTLYQTDGRSGNTVIEVVVEDYAAKGSIHVYEKGDVLTGYEDNDFVYEERFLKDAVFEVYAAEDIYTPDFQTENGKRDVIYAKGELVGELVTGEDGMGSLESIPLGSYEVREKSVPEGYVIQNKSQTVKLEYEDQDTETILQELTFTAARQRVELTAVKKDAENDSVIEGAVLGLYCEKDIVNADGKVILKAESLLQKMETGEDGKAVCTADLPLGSYYVIEEKAPAGYTHSDEKLMFTAEYEGQTVDIVKKQGEIKNISTATEIVVQDAKTGISLDGASMEILSQDGTQIASWTSVKDQPYQIRRLKADETYILRETFAPYGYLKAEDQIFTVENTSEVQKVVMKNEVPTALLIINKKGEFLESVEKSEGSGGVISHFFHYGSGEITCVKFNVYASEDIKSADGISEDFYKSGDLVGTIETDKSGMAKLGDIPAGKYYVIEQEAADGYLLDNEPREVDLSYRDQNTPVITYSEDWQNNRRKAEIRILLKEKDKERTLAGGVFGLYTSEDIASRSGKVLMKADSLIEIRTTDKNGMLSYIADIPMGGSYYVKEIIPPKGFVCTEESQEFEFPMDKNEDGSASYEFAFENEATVIQLVKLDQKTGKNLSGASLCVTDSYGNKVVDWISQKDEKEIKELTVGDTYKMVELKPAHGYVTARSVSFTVKNTSKTQKVEMEDDVTKVRISKTVTSGGGEIPGAILSVLDQNDKVVEHWITTDEVHYVEKLPIGKYTIREEQAPAGYAMAVDVEFEVKDTPEVQSVSMTNETAKGKVLLNKTDAENEEPLMGVEFELRDADGKVLETLKTDAAGHAESGLYEISQKYYLVETKALDGYLLDKTEQEISFEYKGENTPIIEVTKNLTNKADPDHPHVQGTSTTTGISENPKTGDETNLWMLVVLMVVSFCGMAGFFVTRRKRK